LPSSAGSLGSAAPPCLVLLSSTTSALGTFAPLEGLLRLISCPPTISLHNHYYRSQVLSARQLGLAIFLRSFGSLHLAPALCSATCYGSLSYSLKKNTVPAVLRTLSFLHRFSCTASCSLLAPCLLPCQHRAVVLACTVPCVRQLGLAIFLRSLVSLRLTPALRSATSSNGFKSYSLEGIRMQSQQHTQQPATINSYAPPASLRELPARHTSAGNDRYTYCTSHSAPLAPPAVLPIRER